MSSIAPLTVEKVAELHDAGESLWPKISPDFDQAMIKGLETGKFEDPKNDKTVDLEEVRKAYLAGAGVDFVPLSDLRDTQDRPVVLGKRYLFRVADRERDRTTDFEDDNLKRVVNNSKWHNGIHLVLEEQYRQHDHIFIVKYPGKGKWLMGTLYEKNDVVLGASPSNSVWMFQNWGRESHGFPSYGIWAERWGAADYGDGFWMPQYSIARAGYDNDWEWRTYQLGSEQGWFKIMFERVDYNE